jgi:polyisoprenoid-binding protein YceI
MATTREVDGTTLPAAGTWAIDPTHTNIAAVARHLMVTKVRGEFGEFTGSIVVGDNPADSSAKLTIQAKSITTGVEDRDNHLRSADFLDADNFKELRFESTSIKLDGTSGQVSGDLTIRDITQPITLDFEFLGVITDPFGNDKAAFSATGDLERENWGLTWNVPLETGGVLVSKTFKLEIEAQAVLQS